MTQTIRLEIEGEHVIVNPSSGRTAPRRHTIQSVQVLRAFAASQVLIGHILLDLATRYHVDLFGFDKLPWLNGVDIFFCVSGFIMMLTSWDHFHETGYPAKFMLHRIVRVVPLYYLFTTLMVAVVLLSPQMLGATKLDLTQIWTSYLFFPFQRANGDVQPVLSVGWTLNYEMFFYTLFAAALFCPRRIAFALLAFVFVTLASVHACFDQLPIALGFWSHPIILEFVAGAGVAYLYRRDIRLRHHPVLAFIGVSAAIVLLFGRDALLNAFDLHLPHMLQVGLPALLLLAACTLLIPDSVDRKCPRWIVSLGDSSYSLYLSHRFAMRAAAAVWSGIIRLAPAAADHYFAYAAGVFAVCLLVGHAVHLWIERPLTRLVSGTIERRATSNSRPIDRRLEVAPRPSLDDRLTLS